MTSLYRAAPIFVLVALIGCGGNSPTATDAGLTLDDLVGSWIATSDLFTNNADASETFDVVDNGGEVRFTMLAGGGTRIWSDDGTVSDEWDSQVTLSGSTLTVDPVEAGRATRVWEITLVNGVLTMTDESTSFDFTLSGATPVSATEVIVWVPNI